MNSVDTKRWSTLGLNIRLKMIEKKTRNNKKYHLDMNIDNEIQSILYIHIYTIHILYRERERVREKISQIPILIECYSTPVLFWIPVGTAGNYARSRHKRASADFVESCLGGGSTPAAKPMAFRPA